MSIAAIGDSKIHNAQRFVEEQKYDLALDWIDAFCLEKPQESESVSRVCALLEQLLPRLTFEKKEKALHQICLLLKEFPALKNEGATFLTHYGQLNLEKKDFMTAMGSFTVAYTLNPQAEQEKYIVRTFFLFALKMWKQRLQKVAGAGNTQLFQVLLDNIVPFHERFSQYPTDIQAYYEAGREVYRGLNEKNRANFIPFLNALSHHTQEHPPKGSQVIGYRTKLTTLRALQKGSWKDFFAHLFEDALWMLGEPPCGYDIRAVGSLARGEMCPYSDIEYFILIEDEQHRAYFQAVAEIFEMQIRSLGETDPKYQEIFQFGQRPGIEIDHQANPATKPSLIGKPSALFILKEKLEVDELQAFASKLQSLSLHSNHSFNLSVDISGCVPQLLNMHLQAFAELKILRAETCHLKDEFTARLNYYLQALGFHFGIIEPQISTIIDRLPLFDNQTKSF